MKNNVLKKTSLALGLALALAGGSAGAIAATDCSNSAAPCVLPAGDTVFANVAAGVNKPFTDYFSFHLDGSSSVDGWLFSLANRQGNYTVFFDTISLLQGASTIWNEAIGGSFFAKNDILGSGDYTAIVTGHNLTGSKTSFGAGIDVAAVPEPGEWAMILAGLGMIGMIARRRSFKS